MQELLSPNVSRPISIRRASPIPIYFQIAEQLTRFTAADVATPLPPITVLAEALSVSANTVRHAYHRLVADGHAVQRHGSHFLIPEGQVDRNAGFTNASTESTLLDSVEA